MRWTLPDYGQRASFVNGIAQNILASLLHIIRPYRATDPDYHYTNPQALARLGQFVEDGCDALLIGLLGDGTRLEDMFPDSTRDGTAVYPQWRERTATELIYWTARQSLDGDCFAAHLQQEGSPCPVVRRSRLAARPCRWMRPEAPAGSCSGTSPQQGESIGVGAFCGLPAGRHQSTRSTEFREECHDPHGLFSSPCQHTASC